MKFSSYPIVRGFSDDHSDGGLSSVQLIMGVKGIYCHQIYSSFRPLRSIKKIQCDFVEKLSRRLISKEKKVQKMLSDLRETCGNRMETLSREHEATM